MEDDEDEGKEDEVTNELDVEDKDEEEEEAELVDVEEVDRPVSSVLMANAL
ncbi:hypothetical protein HMI55_006200 [Coelomomyces lativittatus]|nr:hypothetical protein HMI55_006200 [Coelomomyces lativittatus]